MLVLAAPCIDGQAAPSTMQAVHYRCAIIDLELARPFVEPSAETDTARARSHHALRQYSAAIAVYDSLLTVGPDNVQVRTCREAARMERQCDVAANAHGLMTGWFATFNSNAPPAERYQSAQRRFDLVFSSLDVKDDAWVLLKAARRQLASGDSYLAWVIYDKLLEVVPWAPDLIAGRGNVFLALGRYDDAVAEYTRALAADTDVEGLLHELFEHEARWGAGTEDMPALFRYSFSPEFSDLDHLISLHEARAHAYGKLGRLEEAWADYANVLRLVPAHAAARRAMERLKPYLEVQAALPGAAVSLPVIPGLEGDGERSTTRLRGYRRVADLYGPDDGSRRSSPYANDLSRAQRYLERGMFDEALEHFQFHVQRYPTWGQAWAEVGEYHIAVEDYGAALAAFTRAIELDPPSDEYYAKRARVRYDMGAYALAVADFTRWLEHAPEDASARAGRAMAYVELGRDDLALVDLSVYLGRYPEDAWGHFKRAQSLARLGRLSAALTAATRTVRLAPRYGRAYELKALLHFALANRPSARLWPTTCYPASE